MKGITARRRASRLKALSASSLIAFCAMLQPALADGGDDEIIVSATRTPQRAAEVGASVTVIEAPEIELRQYESVSDVLRDTAGVSIARNTSFGGVSSVRIRGAASGQSLVMIDGIVVNDPSAPSGGFDFANLDVVDIERIEILRGPQSILYGADAIGGVVSIITKRAEQGVEASGFMEGGSLGLARGAATIAAAGDSLDGRLTFSGTRTDGISRAAIGTEKDGFRSIATSFSGGAQLSPEWRAQIIARYGDSRAEIDGYAPPTYAFDDTDETQDTEELALAGRLTQQGERLYQSFTVAYNDITRTYRNAGVFQSNAQGERISADYFARYEFSKRFSTLVGVEAERSAATVSGVDDAMKNVSVFALAEAKPFDGLSLSAGVRHDEFDEFDGATTGRVTAAFEASPSTIIRASWGQGFRAPSIFQLNYNLYGGPGNPDIKPERSNAFDASLEQSITDSFTAKVTLFHQNIRNQIDFDYPSGGYVNIARTRSRGVEVEASWRPAEAISARLQYTFVDAIDRSTDLQLLRQPKHSGGLFVDISPIDRLSLGASLIVNGEERDSGGDNDAWARVDVRASYGLTDALEIYGRVENAGDKTYQDVAGYAEPGRTAFGGVRLRL